MSNWFGTDGYSCKPINVLIIAVSVVVFLSVGIFAASYASQQDRHKHRDVQVACIKSGKSLVEGNCIEQGK